MSDELTNEPICELDDETKNHLKETFTLIKTPSDLLSKVEAKINFIEQKSNKKIFYKKPALIAASIAIIIVVGSLFPIPFTKLPTLAQIHSLETIEWESGDIKFLSQKAGFELKDEYFNSLGESGFQIIGGRKIKTALSGKEITVIVMKNSNDEKVSLCFLPKGYSLNNCHDLQVLGIKTNGKIDAFITDREGKKFKCGVEKNCHFAFWEASNRSIAVVSESVPDLKMISLVLPLHQSNT